MQEFIAFLIVAAATGGGWYGVFVGFGLTVSNWWALVCGFGLLFIVEVLSKLTENL